jgi:hypothetical protein
MQFPHYDESEFDLQIFPEANFFLVTVSHNFREFNVAKRSDPVEDSMTAYL